MDSSKFYSQFNFTPKISNIDLAWKNLEECAAGIIGAPQGYQIIGGREK
jgi:hypothetical protein